LDKLSCLTVGEERGAGAEDDRCEVDSKLIDQPEADGLADHVAAAHHDDILLA